MTLTILFDLDDTLFSNSTHVFIPAFLELFCQNLGKHVTDPSDLATKLVSATQSMAQNNDPGKDLKQVFDANFYPSIGWSYQDLEPEILEFYQNSYPKLKQLTSPIPEVPALIDQLIERGHEIVIATNPIYPQMAVEQRLAWAGLEDYISSFKLITSYENMHFAKPNPAYYAEILGQLGWPENPVVMVGDDINADITPANQLGIPTYWVNSDYDYTQDGLKQTSGSGPQHQFVQWLDQQDHSSLVPDLNSITATTTLLRATPAALSSLIKTLPGSLWNQSVSEDEWSLTEIFCHLRDVDREVFLPRIQHVKESDRPFIEAVDADKWAAERKYREQDGIRAFVDFTAARIELLNVIDSLEKPIWEKEIRHTIFGPILLPELIAISARHDKLHIQQIHETLSRISR